MREVVKLWMCGSENVDVEIMFLTQNEFVCCCWRLVGHFSDFPCLLVVNPINGAVIVSQFPVGCEVHTLLKIKLWEYLIRHVLDDGVVSLVIRLLLLIAHRKYLHLLLYLNHHYVVQLMMQLHGDLLLIDMTPCHLLSHICKPSNALAP